MPSLALELHDGDVRLDALQDGTARIAGSIRSGEGTLRVDGSLGWRGDDTPLVLNVTGDKVLAADTRDLHAVIAPNVAVRYAAKQPLEVTGTVTVQEARIALEGLEGGATRSPDVVVLDPVDPEAHGRIHRCRSISRSCLPEGAVALNGFGLDGTLDRPTARAPAPGHAK